jgi:hypothetical protein
MNTENPGRLPAMAPQAHTHDPAATLAQQCFALIERMQSECSGMDVPANLADEEDQLEGTLADPPALTLTGVAKKIRAALWVDADENEPADQEEALLFSALRDLDRMCQESGLPVVASPRRPPRRFG